MTPFLRILSSVTRWLSVVVGCAILEMAQPMIAAPESSSGPRPDDLVIQPSGGSAPFDPAAPSSGSSPGAGWIFVLLIGASSVAYWFWNRRRPLSPAKKNSIQIEDTRPLGNRQFLVVAQAGGRRFFLGVSPGGIRLLAPLDEDDLEIPPHA